MDWRLRRKQDLLAQKKYAEDHPWCEICLAEGRGKRRAEDVHEILFRSLGGKCVPENEISACRPDHDRAHRKRKPYLTREVLFEIKRKEAEFGADKLEEARRGAGRYEQEPVETL